jgi:hypothetical protein
LTARAAIQADVDQNEADADAAIAALQADVDANEAAADASKLMLTKTKLMLMHLFLLLQQTVLL